MARPHEPYADALRIAREIVEREGRALAKAWNADVANDDDRIDRAKDSLARRIAEAITDAEELGRASAASNGEPG